MHATCELNNVATTASTTTTTGAATVLTNINNSEEQHILVNSLERNSCNRDKTNSSHNHHLNNSPDNCSTKTDCNDDDLFMSASSSTTDFCGKVATPTERATINILAEASDFLSLKPSSPNKSKLIISPKHQIIKRTDSNSIDIDIKTSRTTAISTESKTVIPDLVLSSTPVKPASKCLNISSHSVSTSLNTEISSSTAITNNNGSSIAQISTVTAITATKETATSSGQESATAITKSVISSSLFQRIEYEDLLQWKDMPKHLQFNPYVLTGYRPLSSVRGCFFSLFYWHNETINILTHGIPIVYILATVPSLMPWEKDFRFLSFCHIFGAVAPWCGSFVYHLFMNLERGENIYYRLLKMDMVGIWISQSFGALPMVTASVYCFGYKMKWLMIIGYCILSLWGLYKALNATSPWQRRLCFALPFTMRVFLTFFRTLRWVGGNPQALTHVYLQDLVSVFGGAIGAMHIPEKWFPGSVDLYLNSHNIMHVLVVVAVYSMHKATVSDFEWMSKIECNNFYNSTVTIENSMNEHFEL